MLSELEEEGFLPLMPLPGPSQEERIDRPPRDAYLSYTRLVKVWG
jgi:hypothetical protein